MKSLLIVDDESDILMGFKKSLENGEMQVDTAETFEEAKKLIEEKEYGCVITDIRLAGDSDDGGFEVLRHVKRVRPLTRVIVITGHGNVSTMQDACALGADFYFEKPVSVNTLKKSLKKLRGVSEKKNPEQIATIMDGVSVEDVNGARVVHFTGELTIEKAKDIRGVLSDMLTDTRDLVLNVRSVIRADTSCFQIFCAAHRACAGLDISLTLSGERSSAFTSAVRDLGFARHSGCMKNRACECFWYDEMYG